MTDKETEIGFLPVTHHYGYTYEKYNNQWQYLIWEHVNGEKCKYPVACRVTRKDAMYECRLLEALNFERREE